MNAVDILLKVAAKQGAPARQPPQDEEAYAALQRLKDLERTKLTKDQMIRYGALGGTTGIGIGAIGDLIEGGKIPFGYNPELPRGKRAVGVVRNMAASFAKGALSAGAVPLIRTNLDREAEIGTLKDYVRAKRSAGAAPAQVAPAPVLPEHATPELKVLPPPEIMTEPKMAGVPTTPRGRLARSKAVGVAPHSIDSGPSIADIAKPHGKGFGNPLPGATKALEKNSTPYRDNRSDTP